MPLPDDFRDTVKAAFFKVGGPKTTEFNRYIALADKVCDRAERLGKAGKLTGSVVEVADVIYGGWYLWLLYWNNRDVIWQIAKLLAELTFTGDSAQRVVVTARRW